MGKVRPHCRKGLRHITKLLRREGINRGSWLPKEVVQGSIRVGFYDPEIDEFCIVEGNVNDDEGYRIRRKRRIP